VKPIVIANWKMNLAGEAAQQLLDKICQGVKDIDSVEVVVCPALTDLVKLSVSANCPIIKGAQDIHWEDKGTYTGEVSGPMLKETGCRYVIVGHSERRWKLQENNEVVNEKLKAALRSDLIPILCVGERLSDREEGRTAPFLQEQLRTALEGVGREDIESLVVAYEPVWAIGTGQIKSRQAATPDIVQDAFKVIEKFLDSQNLREVTRLIYGGSVDSDNVGGFAKLELNQGFLVGGASLDANEFISIIKKTAS